MPRLLVVVGSTNPVKQQAVARGLAAWGPNRAWDVVMHAVPSGVSAQPRTLEETRRGARQRALAAREAVPQGQMWFGLEGGLTRVDDRWFTFGWVAVLDWTGRWGEAQSAAFPLPPAVARLIDQGWELGPADDAVFGTQHSKHGPGAVGLITQGRLRRVDLYTQAVILALAPLWRPDLYPAGGDDETAATPRGRDPNHA
ncbi:MAG: DUF84 family protein [Chloroflexi bacterium]|nr:DUF84 family protein [Chloroflexota bacterium]